MIVQCHSCLPLLAFKDMFWTFYKAVMSTLFVSNIRVHFTVVAVRYEAHISTWHISCLFKVLAVEKAAWLFLEGMKKHQCHSLSICIRAQATGRTPLCSPGSESFSVQQRELMPTTSLCLVWKSRENHQISWIEGTLLLNHSLG